MRRAAGFTVLEMIIAVAILAIISIGTLIFSKPMIELWGTQNFMQGPAREGRLALMRMVREIDQVRNVQSISSATATGLSFVDTNNDTITYALSSGVLTRRVGDTSQTARNFASGLSSFAFTYRDKDNSVLNSPTVGLGTSTNIRTVEIGMTVTVGSRSKQLTATAHPRNVLE